MHADPHSYTFKLAESQPAEGRQVLCIERVKKEPWALATQSSGDPALRGARVRLSMAVRVEGPAPMRAGPWLFVHGMHGRLAHQERMVTVSPEWQRVSVEITVPQNVRLLEFGTMVYDGGRACVDDVRLEILGR